MKKHFLAERYQKLFGEQLIKEEDNRPSYRDMKNFLQAMREEYSGYDYPMSVGITDGYDTEAKQVNTVNDLLFLIIMQADDEHGNVENWREYFNDWNGDADTLQDLASASHYESRDGMVVGISEDVAIILDYEVDESINEI